MPSPTKREKCLLGLPLELRLLIFQNLHVGVTQYTRLDHSTEHEFCRDCDDTALNHDPQEQIETMVNLTLTCRQLYQECTPILYDKTTFWFSLTIAHLNSEMQDELGPSVVDRFRITHGYRLNRFSCDPRFDDTELIPSSLNENIKRAGLHIRLPEYLLPQRQTGTKEHLMYWKVQMDLDLLIEALNNAPSLRSLVILYDASGLTKEGAGSVDLGPCLQRFENLADQVEISLHDSHPNRTTRDQPYMAKLQSASRSAAFGKPEHGPLLDMFKELFSWTTMTFNFLTEQRSYQNYEINHMWPDMLAINDRTGDRIVELLRQAWAASDWRDINSLVGIKRQLWELAARHYQQYLYLLIPRKTPSLIQVPGVGRGRGVLQQFRRDR